MSTTTTISFTPSETAAPPFTGQFQTSNGSYVFETRWNLSGQRWYMFIYDQSGDLLMTVPMVSSSQSIDITLGTIPDVAIYYSAINSTFTVVTAS